MSCLVCHNSDENIILSANGSRQAWGFSFKYVSCSFCKSLTINGIPENLSTYYQDYYSFQELTEPCSIRDKFKKILTMVAFANLPFHFKRVISKYFLNQENDFKLTSLFYLNPKKNWKILDVGTGAGDFIYNLYELGFNNAIGIDPFLKESIFYENGAKIFKKDLYGINDTYDLITFHHSFEHLEHPEQYLEKVKNLLNPRGVCLIRLPSIDCLSYKIFKEHWAGIHAPYHIFLPSYKGMEMLLKPFGLKIQSCIGEQVIDFFLISKENFMGIPDNHEKSIRSVIKKKGSVGNTTWHCKKELSYWKSMKKLVEKNKLCDCVAYYITHEKN